MTTEDLSIMTEGALLSIVEILLAPKFSHLKAHETIPFLTGLTRSHVDQAKADKGSIGGKAWMKIEKHLTKKLYHLWLEHQ